MKESNQVRKLLIASAVIVLTVPAIASAAPEEAESQQTLVGALDAGQATAGKVITLEDFEGGSGREQVFIPAKRADSSTSAAAMGQLLLEQQLQIDKKLDADREALDKKIEAQLRQPNLAAIRLQEYKEWLPDMLFAQKMLLQS